jgi:RNA polymerase sigma factor (sigma-70 family)
MFGLRAEGEGSPASEVSDVEALFREYHPRVYAYVRYRIADVAEAEDLTSEIVERALTHLASYDARKGAFSTWLFRIAHNTWVNHLKRRQRRNPHHVDLGEGLEDLAADEPTPEQAVLHKEETAQLLKCLGTLSSRQQEILSLRFAGRLTNREIAKVLRMNERTVSVTILRALRKLRQRLVGSDTQ